MPCEAANAIKAGTSGGPSGGKGSVAPSGKGFPHASEKGIMHKPRRIHDQQARGLGNAFEGMHRSVRDLDVIACPCNDVLPLQMKPDLALQHIERLGLACVVIGRRARTLGHDRLDQAELAVGFRRERQKLQNIAQNVVSAGVFLQPSSYSHCDSIGCQL